MEPIERLEIAANAIDTLSRDQLSAIDTTPEELAKSAVEYDIKPDEYTKLLGVMVYVKQRLVLKQGRVEAFKAAFPERCYVVDLESPYYKKEDSKLGDPLTKSTIAVKAKRLESSKLYAKVYTMLQQNLYVSYAVSRLQVLDEALAKSLDPHVADRDKPQFMKIFLEETRKPESAKGMELNLNLTTNNISVTDIEDRMSGIATRLDGMDASKIIEAVHSDSRED